MSRSALALTVTQAVKLGLAPLLHKDGFKKRGTNFYQITPESNRLVFVQSSQWNSSSRSRFTIELGLYFPAIDAVTNETWTRAGAKQWNPKIYNCQLRQRIGFLMPVGGDFWWTVTPSSDANELALEMAKAWQQYGAAWMRSNADLPYAATRLEAESGFLLAAQARLALGERAKASRLAKQYVVSLTKEAPHPANAAIIEKYLAEIRGWCARHEMEL
ncbi:MAG TPA: DUF4304 domain-containing protein [Candidatus Acidoferrales bacterium]|jgi:hypothetical protein|nr:DUF4304 domain-containing protein [Candidatus Acidoferrales bacterium]